MWRLRVIGHGLFGVGLDCLDGSTTEDEFRFLARIHFHYLLSIKGL